MATVNEKMTALADAIRAKSGVTDKLSLDGMKTAVDGIEKGIDTSDATATSSDLLSGKTAYAKGSKVTGTIPTRTSANLTASGATVTVPSGYYASQTSKAVSTATQATPSVSISTSGLITASATQTAGYVSAGTKSGTKQLTTQGAKTVTPTTTSQTAVASGRYTTGTVTVAGDSNLVASNIKSGVSIFGVAGTYEGSGGSSGGGSSGVQYEIVTIPAGATSATHSLPAVTKAVGSIILSVYEFDMNTQLPISINDNLVYCIIQADSDCILFESYIIRYSGGTITCDAWAGVTFVEPITLLLIYDPNKPTLM